MKKKKPYRRDQKRRLELLRLSLILIFIIPFVTWRTWTDGSGMDFAVEWGGYVFLVAGLGLRIWAILYVGGRKSKALVTDGPYSLCRNPLYLGTILATFGASFCMESLLMALAGLALVMPTHVLIAKAEERRLAARFPDEFDAYARSVPSFIPSLKSYHSPSEIVVSTQAVRRILGHTAIIILVPILGDLVEMLHAHNLLPVLLRL